MSLEDVDIRLHMWAISYEKVKGCMISDEVPIKKYAFCPMGCIYYDVGLE